MRSPSTPTRTAVGGTPARNAGLSSPDGVLTSSCTTGTSCVLRMRIPTLWDSNVACPCRHHHHRHCKFRANIGTRSQRSSHKGEEGRVLYRYHDERVSSPPLIAICIYIYIYLTATGSKHASNAHIEPSGFPRSRVMTHNDALS